MLYFDLDLRLLVTRPGYASPLASLRYKRGDLQTLEVQYCRGASLVELSGAEPVIRWGIKETLSGALLAMADTWTNVEGVYKAPFSTNTVELLANLGNSASKKYLGELTFTDDNGGPTSSQTIPVTIENDVNKEEDLAPTNLPSPSDWLSARAVRHDLAQALTDPQKAQALDNLGIALLAMLTSDKSGVNLLENSEGGVELGLWNPDSEVYEPIGAFGVGGAWKIDTFVMP
jgi:hypothetical protein